MIIALNLINKLHALLTGTYYEYLSRLCTLGRHFIEVAILLMQYYHMVEWRHLLVLALVQVVRFRILDCFTNYLVFTLHVLFCTCIEYCQCAIISCPIECLINCM